MRTSLPTMPRSYSTSELRAAAAALAAGRFSTSDSGLAARAAPEQTKTTRRSGADRDETNLDDPNPDDAAVAATLVAGSCGGSTSTSVPGLAGLLRVRAANAGAGASTVALALADAADAAGVRARVLDAAAPRWSGLLAATVTELGAADGWRRGRRGTRLLIDRVESPVRALGEVPVPRQVEGVDLTVLDAGWSVRELSAAPGAWVTSAHARVEVLVARPHGLALSQAEAALAGLEEQLTAGQVVVVVVGATRWIDRELVAAGRLLCRAHEQDAVMFAPLLSVKALPRLGSEPLPHRLMNPAHRLLERITNITGPLTAIRT
jgi:hypothetical protein